jgi:hypothetical protein
MLIDFITTALVKKLEDLRKDHSKVIKSGHSLIIGWSEQPEIKKVYDSLFSEEGSEIYLKPASLYFHDMPVEVTFADCMRIAQKRQEVCIGLKIKAFEPEPIENYGVKLVPEKNMKFILKAEDSLIVLAENET